MFSCSILLLCGLFKKYIIPTLYFSAYETKCHILQPTQQNSITYVASEQVPVYLTPDWEKNNLPNDEHSFIILGMDDTVLETDPPKDKWNIVQFILVLHGIGICVPKNIFISAKDYFVNFKFEEEYLRKDSYFAESFMLYLTIVTQLPNLLLICLNILYPIRGTRYVWSILFELFCFLITIALVLANTSKTPGIFFWATLGSILLLNIANSFYINFVFGIAAKLPTKYMSALIFGINICSTIIYIVNLLSMYISSDIQNSAKFYFTIALLIMFVCYNTYFVLPLNKFYKYYEEIYQLQIEIQKSTQCEEKEKIQYRLIIKQAFTQLLNIFGVFFITFSIYPNVQLDIKSSNPNFFIKNKYLSSALSFVTFNLFAFFGTYISTLFTWPKPKWLFIPVLLRFVFIPLYLYSNYQPFGITRTMTVFITNDYLFWILRITLALSNGYYSSVAMAYIQRCVEPKYSDIVKMYGTFMKCIGSFGGVLMGMIMPKIIK